MRNDSKGGGAPRVRTPKVKLKETDPIFHKLPEARKPTVVVHSFKELIAASPFFGHYADDIYHGVRGIVVSAAHAKTGYGSVIIPSAAVHYKEGDLITWAIYGKPLKPKLAVVTSSVELRKVLAQCGKATILPTLATPRAKYIEAVAHLPDKGTAIVIRVPGELFTALPKKLAEQVYARDLRHRLLGSNIVRTRNDDPDMLRPIGCCDRRISVRDYTEEVPTSPRPQVQPPPPPPGPSTFRSRFFEARQPSDWIGDPNAPEHDLMKWDLTLFDVAEDLGLKTAYRIVTDTANRFGWSAVLANPHTQSGFARWRMQRERALIETLTRLFPAVKKHAKRVSDAFNIGTSIFGSAKKAAESAKAAADRIAQTK